MTYLDYSATTPVNDEVLNTFNFVTKKYIGNPNSLHKLGVEAKNVINASTLQIAKLLNVKENEIIYTSGASEANNTVIKGIAYEYKNRGNRIISTRLEHSSIYGPLKQLELEGFKVDYVKTNNGIVDLNDLEKLMDDDVILVSICTVNSETGLLEPIDEIGKLLKKYPKCFFHTDMTQALGKVKIDLKNVDLASFSAHKIYGLDGIGLLYKKENIHISPLISGGKSTTIYRSGTPCVGLIASLSKAIRLSLESLDKRYEYVSNLNNILKKELSKLDITINSNEFCIPHILNISINPVKPETMLHALEAFNIYISTKTACSTSLESTSVFELTHDQILSRYSLRISLSYLTKMEEINYFIEKFSECLNELRGVSNGKNR